MRVTFMPFTNTSSACQFQACLDAYILLVFGGCDLSSFSSALQGWTGMLFRGTKTKWSHFPFLGCHRLVVSLAGSLSSNFWLSFRSSDLDLAADCRRFRPPGRPGRCTQCCQQSLPDGAGTLASLESTDSSRPADGGAILSATRPAGTTRISPEAGATTSFHSPRHRRYTTSGQTFRTRRELAADRKKANSEMSQVPIGIFYCPTRCRVDLYPFSSRNFSNLEMPASGRCNKTDYAACVGSIGSTETDSPSDLPTGDSMTWPDPSTWTESPSVAAKSWPPMFSTGRAIRSCTARRKSMPITTRTVGFLAITTRCCWGSITTCIVQRWETLQQDRPGFASTLHFGSAHYSGCAFVLCDGSVHRISYGIDPTTFKYLGSRNDQQPVDGTSF